MTKTIYRICLIVCLAIAIGAGLFLYEKQQEKQEDQREWTLVERQEEKPGAWDAQDRCRDGQEPYVFPGAAEEAA